MNRDPFYRLAPFIQEYIYRAGWGELRSVQVKAISAVLDTSNHILITSGTASGKTEAAFLPILTQLYENPPVSIGVLYIGPLKALINDQFIRLTALLDESHIPVQGWHGDVADNKKRKFLQNARGILQITPESLEALLMRRNAELPRLFGDLRFIIVDEIHAFINSDRGRQVLCQIQRLARFQKTPARRIGLSATLGTPELAMEWLKGGTDLTVSHVNDDGGKRIVEFGVEHFIDYQKQIRKLEDFKTENPLLYELQAKQKPFYDHIYDIVNRETKTLIFGGSRDSIEEIALQLRKIATVRKEPDIYHVHHGMIATPLREAAEDAMRLSEHPACTLATMTLELGIDIGSLDQVLQVKAASSVSSFVQRLGRSGRRAGRTAKMFFYSTEAQMDDDASLGKRIPWDLLQTIAIIQLYAEERWVEPPEIPIFPFSLLYHQTMSTLFADNELSPSQLAEAVLSLSPFQHITQEHYRTLLRHLIDLKHLERTETGSLIIGLEAEHMVNNYKFFATFKEDAVFQVREGSREIGFIQGAVPENNLIRLAGFVWRVLRVELEQHLIFVEPGKGKPQTFWLSNGSSLHGRILQRMRQVLAEESEYGYLQIGALKRLREARDLAQQTHLLDHNLIPVGGDQYLLLPWASSRVFATLSLLLDSAFDMSPIVPPYYFQFKAPGGQFPSQILHNIAVHYPSVQQIADRLSKDQLVVNKFDAYIPAAFLRDAISKDVLDVSGTQTFLQQWVNDTH